MDRSIRRLGGFMILLFCALFVQLNYIQVFRASDLNRKPGNDRPIEAAFNLVGELRNASADEGFVEVGIGIHACQLARSACLPWL